MKEKSISNTTKDPKVDKKLTEFDRLRFLIKDRIEKKDTPKKAKHPTKGHHIDIYA